METKQKTQDIVLRKGGKNNRLNKVYITRAEIQIEQMFDAENPWIFKEIRGFFLKKIRKKLLHFMSTPFILRNRVGENGVNSLD